MACSGRDSFVRGGGKGSKSGILTWVWCMYSDRALLVGREGREGQLHVHVCTFQGVGEILAREYGRIGITLPPPPPPA